jgi:hypothetical protein
MGFSKSHEVFALGWLQAVILLILPPEKVGLQA